MEIYNNKDILLRPRVDAELKPTLRSLLDTIAHDPDKVSENILMRISHNKMSADTERKLLAHLETASDNIRYEYSKKGSVSNGKLLTGFRKLLENIPQVEYQLNPTLVLIYIKQRSNKRS